ncbi:MAG: HAD-IIIA family hydrolase [SAR324 cluster bacterium]|nr:HAD-IIIA family hydrolase [SAR324 cluster bacterium]
MSAPPSPPPIFLDRDGTIIEEVRYLSSLDMMRLIPGSAAAIHAAKKAGHAVVVISNQSAVARGIISDEFARQSGDHLKRMLTARGAPIDGYYYCPDHPEGKPPYDKDSAERKPRPGMMLRAARDLGIELNGAYMIGDKLSDTETGAELGVRPILVRTGYGREEESRLGPAFFQRGGAAVDDLAAAVALILSRAQD